MEVILKFWMQDKESDVPCGGFHNLVIKAVPALDYSNQGKPFVYLTSERRVDKLEDGDCSYDEPGYMILVKSYEIVEELSDNDWENYIELGVFDRIGDLQLSLFAKHVPVGERDKTDGFLCMDIPTALGEKSSFKGRSSDSGLLFYSCLKKVRILLHLVYGNN